MTLTQYKVNFRSMPWTRTTCGVRQKFFKFDDHQLRLVEARAKDMLLHWCKKGHGGYMLEEKMEVRFEKEIRTYSAGDGVYLPAGSQHKHCARILTDTATLVLLEEV